jgi:hypothetical protein
VISNVPAAANSGALVVIVLISLPFVELIPQAAQREMRASAGEVL